MQEIDTSEDTPGYRLFKIRLVLGLIGLVACLGLILSWKIYSTYQHDRETARSQTKSFARAMNAHVLSSAQLIDLSLIGVSNSIATLPPETRSRPEAIERVMRSMTSATDTNYWLIYLDAKGQGVASSKGLPVLGVDYSDRDYYRAHASTPPSLGAPPRDFDAIEAQPHQIFVGGPAVGRVSKRKSFFISRKVISDKGELIGVIAATVDAAGLARVFESARFTEDLSVTLMHDNGGVVARAPMFEETFGKSLTDSALFAAIQKQPMGSFESLSTVSKDERIFSYEKLPGMPMTVAVGIAKKTWTARVVSDLIVAGICFAILSGVMLFSGRFALHSYKRMELSRARQKALANEASSAKDLLAKSEKMVREITDNLPAFVAYVDASERYVFHNSQYQRLPGARWERMLGHTMREALGEEIYSSLEPEVKRALQGERLSFERQMSQGDGEEALHLQYELVPNLSAAGETLGFYSMITDLTERKKTEKELHRLARFDNLTGLPNRSQIYERLEQSLMRCERSGGILGCLYLDVDHFKQINDTHGHAGGDEVLRQFGQRITECVRKTDLAGRLAGDEFVIILEGMEQPDGALRVAQKIIDSMSEPFMVGGQALRVTTSIGAATSAQAPQSADDLLKKADEALYLAKRGGRNGVEARP